MYGPISTTGRAIMASVRQLEQSGMPRDQAIATARQRLMDNIDPDIEKMMFQVQQLQQQRQQPPQMTIRDQLNQVSGINTLPNPDFNPRFAGGGIVAFAGPEGSLVIDEMMPPRMTPEQINLQREMQQAAERRMGMGNYGIGLENYPEMIEDVPESQRIVSRVVDDKGNVWHKTADGEWRMASGSRLQGARVESGRLVYPDRPTPMQREMEAWRRSQAAGGEGIRSVRGAGGGGGAGTPPATGAAGAAGESPGIMRRGLGALRSGAGYLARSAAPLAVGAGMYQASTDALRQDEARRKEMGLPENKSFMESMIDRLGTGPAEPTARARTAAEAVPTGSLMPGGMALPPGVKASEFLEGMRDLGSSFLSGASFGLFGKDETERAQEKKPEAKPQAKPKPIAKPGAAAPATRQPGLFDIPIGIESARAQVAQGMTEEKLFQEENARAQKEQTGPYSQRFTEGDRIKAQRLAELKDSKDRSFARGLVAAGLAMAEQASKGGQPGSETQKFFAAAVAGLGGYAKAQETIGTEIKKAQKEYDDLTFNLETMREEAKGQLRGKAWEKYKYYQDQAEKARDNARGLMIVQTQLEQSMKLAGMKTQSAQQVAAMRMQGQLMAKAYESASKKPAMMAAELRLSQAMESKNPQEQAAARKQIDDLVMQEAQMIMSIPSRAAAIQYNTATGDLDFSAADEIANAALGAGG